VWNPIPLLQDVTCHMGSCSVTCNPTQVNTTLLNHSQTGQYFVYLRQRNGRLSWPRWLVTYRDGLPAMQTVTDTYPSSNQAQCRATLLTMTDALTTTACYQHSYWCSCQMTGSKWSAWSLRDQSLISRDRTSLFRIKMIVPILPSTAQSRLWVTSPSALWTAVCLDQRSV